MDPSKIIYVDSNSSNSNSNSQTCSSSSNSNSNSNNVDNMDVSSSSGSSSSSSSSSDNNKDDDALSPARPPHSAAASLFGISDSNGFSYQSIYLSETDRSINALSNDESGCDSARFRKIHEMIGKTCLFVFFILP